MPGPVDYWSPSQWLQACRTTTLSPIEAARSTFARIEVLNGALRLPGSVGNWDNYLWKSKGTQWW